MEEGVGGGRGRGYCIRQPRNEADNLQRSQINVKRVCVAG